MKVQNGSTVKVEYTGTFEDGTVFDTNIHEGHAHPLEFKVGGGQVIKGFEQAVIGLENNEEKTVTILPKEAYGDKNPQMIQKVPRDKLPAEAQAGMTLAMQLPGGQQFPVQVTELTDTEATLDLNHPLAGKTLIFKIKVVAIE